MHRPRLLGFCAATSVLLFALFGCAKPDDTTSRDTTAESAPVTSSADTGMAGMDRSKMAGMDRRPAKNADHEFLRMMSDHHEGMIQMADEVMERASGATAKADAKELHDKQHEERDRMVAMIESSYGETYHPMAMPNDKAMNNSLQQIPQGAPYDRAFYRNVIKHHREALRMVDDFMPRLTNAEVKSLAAKIRTEQQAEIQEFERKAGR